MFLTDKQVKWAHERYCEGRTLDEIAKALYCNRKTISNEFKKRGLKRVYKPLVYDFKSEAEEVEP